MEMRKQGGEGQGTARSASKSAKKSDEQGSSSDQSTSANQGAGQGTSAAQSTTPNQGTAGKQGGSNQGTAAQNTSGTGVKSPNQGTTQNQGTAGQQGGEQDLLQHAKHAGGEIVNQVQQRAGSEINRGKETAASQLSQVANAVRRIRENLGGEEIGPIVQYAAQYGDKAAESLDRLSNYIRQQNPKQLLDDVQSFGRRRPALLLGGAFLLGFAGARLIKSSMDAGSQQHTQLPTYTGKNVSTPRPSTAPNAV